MNKEEFKRTVLPLSEKLYRFARRLVRDADLAKDCVQDTVLKLWEKRESLTRIGNLQAYCLTVIRNICIDRIRRNVLPGGEPSPRDLPLSIPEYEQRESKQIIIRLIRELPEQQRLVMELRDLEEFSNEEVADALNISINNVRVNLSLARKRIREELTKLYNHGLERT